MLTKAFARMALAIRQYGNTGVEYEKINPRHGFGFSARHRWRCAGLCGRRGQQRSECGKHGSSIRNFANFAEPRKQTLERRHPVGTAGASEHGALSRVA